MDHRIVSMGNQFLLQLRTPKCHRVIILSCWLSPLYPAISRRGTERDAGVVKVEEAPCTAVAEPKKINFWAVGSRRFAIWNGLKGSFMAQHQGFSWGCMMIYDTTDTKQKWGWMQEKIEMKPTSPWKKQQNIDLSKNWNWMETTFFTGVDDLLTAPLLRRAGNRSHLNPQGWIRHFGFSETWWEKHQIWRQILALHMDMAISWYPFSEPHIILAIHIPWYPLVN